MSFYFSLGNYFALVFSFAYVILADSDIAKIVFAAFRKQLS